MATNDDTPRTSTSPLRWPLLALAGVLVVSTVACPIVRPPVPREYYEFRLALQEAVADTVVAEMRARPDIRERLDGRLTDFAAILTTDSLILTLEADPDLRPLAGPVAVALNATLQSKEVGGSVRDAFSGPDGQRQAVDAIVIGLGLALRRTGPQGGEEAYSSNPNSSSTPSPRVASIRCIVSPILLFGVEAPAVRPISTSPSGSHSGSVTMSSLPTIL